VLLRLQGTGDDQLSTEPSIQPTVTLEVYSGRPNPSWPLEGELLATVMERVGDLTGSAEPGRAPTPALGYRGFRLEYLGAGAPDAVFVGRGTVTVVRGKEAEHRGDAVGLERLLLGDAADRGYRDLLEAAGAPVGDDRA
jgi:hypothetical protein